MALAYGDRVCFCECLGDGLRISASLFKEAPHLFLVDIRRTRREFETRRLKHGTPAGARGCEHDLDGHVPFSRSATRLRIAAAVSSIERRDTSMAGHSSRSNNRRVKAISDRIASSST